MEARHQEILKKQSEKVNRQSTRKKATAAKPRESKKAAAAKARAVKKGKK